MTPKDIHALLCMHATGEAPGEITSLLHDGLISQEELFKDGWKLTPKGQCYINALTSIPLPIETWSIPDE